MPALALLALIVVVQRGASRREQKPRGRRQAGVTRIALIHALAHSVAPDQRRAGARLARRRCA